MPQDYDLQIDGKTYGLKWDKPQPPTQSDIEGIVAQYRSQSKQQTAPSATPAASPPDAMSQTLTGAADAGLSGGINPSRADVDEFKYKYFNTFNDQANAPMIVAQGLAKNPTDPALLSQLNSMQSPIAKQAIMEKAQELRSTGNMHVNAFGPLSAPPVLTNPDTGQIARPTAIGDVLAALIHGPEGANQLATRPGAAAEAERFVLHAADPENLAFIAAAGAIGGLGKVGTIAGKAITGSGLVKAGVATMMGANAVDKAQKGDYGGAAVDAALGALPFVEHTISDAVGKAKNKTAIIGTANALDAEQSQIRASIDQNKPYQIPEYLRAPVADPSQARATIDPNLGIITPKPGVTLTPDEQTALDTHNASVRAQRAQPQGEPNVSLDRTTQNTTGNPGVGSNGVPDSVGGSASVERVSGTPEVAPADTPDAPIRSSSEPAPVDAVKSPGVKTANDETNVNRAMEGLPALPDHTWQSNEEIYSHAKERGMDKAALSVADDVLKTGRAMDAHELAANALKQRDIRADRADLRAQIKASAEAGTPTDSLLAEYDALKDQYDKLTQATKRSGTAQSQAFAIRQYELDDYSHENIQDRLQMAKPDVPLTPADTSLVDRLSEGHDTSQKALAEAQDKLDAHLSGKDEIASQKAAQSAIDQMKPKTPRSTRQAVRADQRAALDAEHDDIVNRLVKATSQANALVDPKIVPIIRDLAKNRVKAGLLTVADVVDAVHAAVEPHIPGITKREVRDAISGHGYGSPIPVGTKLSDLKEQMRLLSQIEDAKNKVAAQSRTPRPVSDEVKALRQQKAEAIAENKPPRPAKKPAAEARLEGYKKQLSAKIDDLTRRISQKDFTAQGRSKLLLDPEAEQLKAQRDALQKVYDSLDPAKQKAEAYPNPSKQGERVAQTRLERLTKQFEDLKAQNRSGEYDKPGKPARPDTPAEADMRANVEAARRQRDAMRSATTEGTPADPLKGYKNQLANQIADMQAYIDSGLTDRASGRKVKQLDAEAQMLRDTRDHMRENVNRKRAEIDRVIEARKGKSALDKYAIYHRAAILSRISTLAKLGSAAAQRAMFTPIEEGAGALMRAVPGYGKIADMAPHGTPSMKAEGAAIRSLADFKGNYAESVQKLKTGMNSLDAKYGAKGFEQDNTPLDLFTAPQNAHGAIKTTVQRAAFERSMVQQERYEARQGNDINDPAVRTTMEARAYMKSKEAILMQDNMLSTAWGGMVKGLETNPRLGKAGKNMAAVARAALPIVKVPSNFVGEAISHTPGVGLIRPAYELAISKGIENLSPEQADIITTALKKHAIGTALFAIGYYNADKMGGFYHQGGNGMNDVKPNEVRINLFGKQLPDVPSTFLHSPQMEVMMMGAAFRQAIETAGSRRSRNEVNPAEEAVHRVASGVADSIPFVDTPKRLLQATEGSAQAGKAIGDSIGGATVPGFLPDIASQLDRDPQNHFQTRKRPVKGFGDALKTSIGARVLVPEDTGRKR